jgi:hypothetical protein
MIPNQDTAGKPTALCHFSFNHLLILSGGEIFFTLKSTNILTKKIRLWMYLRITFFSIHFTYILSVVFLTQFSPDSTLCYSLCPFFREIAV